MTVDDHEGALALGARLFQFGHRTLLYLRGRVSSWSNHEYERALSDSHGFGLDVVVMDCGSDMSPGHRVAADAVRLCNEQNITAIVAHNDFVAIGVLFGLGELGVSLPDRLSLAGFDDIPYAAHASSSLTTVRHPGDERAKQA